MTLTQYGLALNFLGSVTVGLTAYFGTISGFGGGVGLKSPWMVWVFWIGWVLFTLGFLVQLLATCKGGKHG